MTPSQSDSIWIDQPDAPPVPIPRGHIGPVALPGTGRIVWWTGRVAIGLRHQAWRQREVGQSELWVQDVMLNSAKADKHLAA